MFGFGGRGWAGKKELSSQKSAFFHLDSLNTNDTDGDDRADSQNSIQLIHHCCCYNVAAIMLLLLLLFLLLCCCYYAASSIDAAAIAAA
jgi:hypothetical protein